VSCHKSQSCSSILSFLAAIFGVIFLALGILGFIPQLHQEIPSYEYLAFDPLHNVSYLTIGLLGIWAATCSRASKLYFRVVGLIILLLGIAGLYYGDETIFGIIKNTKEGTWSHLVIGGIFFLLSFIPQKSCSKE
jgi:hypothetical protein